MFQKILSLLFGLGIIFFPLSALTYSNTTTHPALTSEMVKFYNNFSDKKINDQQRQWMMDGSSKEDIPTTRTLNHFYDPIYQRGLSGEINAGELTPFIKVLEPMILSAKDWAQNSYAQATFLAEAYKNAALNPLAQSTKSAVEILTTHTWEKAINSYINGNQQDAFENLGHILHLIEDMAVPAHVRNDHHLRGDAYENWAAQFGPNNINVVSQLKNKSPLKFNSLNQYFDYLAVYTNTHFYSQDTIGIQTGYNQPEWNYLNTKNIGDFLYSISQDDFGEYLLLKRKIENGLIITTENSVTVNDKLIHADYWSHLSRQAVLTGSGVIDLFFQEVEKYKNDLAFKEKINEAMIKTTLENIKNLFGNLFGDKQTETVNSNFEEIANNANSMNNNSSEQFNEINILLTPTPQIESLNEIIINPSPSFTPSPTPSLSATPLPSPTKTPAPTPTLTPRPTYSPSPSPTPLVTVVSSGNSSKTINFCSISNGIPTSNKIIINELAWMGTENSANDEWIELKNISNESINIANWQLVDKDGQIKISFPSKILAPGEFYFLKRDVNSITSIQADATFSGAINNNSEILQLFDSHCILQDEAKTNENGQWPAGDGKEKRSMERDTDLTWHTYSGEINNGIFGTPKQENSLKIIEPSPSPSPSPSETPLSSPLPSPSPSSTPTPTPISAAQILISEILYDAEGSDEGKEFIELYNPNNFEVDLSDWSLRLIKNNETTSNPLGKIETNENHIISPRGFLLIGYNTYSSSTYNIEADILRISYTLPNPTQGNIYTIRLLNKEGAVVDEIIYQENSCLTGASLERKAKETSTSISMTEGEDQFLGNGYDSDLMTDFIIRSPQPQNSSSLPEPRAKPPIPENISYQFTNGGLMLYFSLSQPVTSSVLEFESFYSYFKEDLSNNFGSSTSTIFSATIKITKADWMNKSFEGMIEEFPLDQLNYLYLRMRSKDKDGLISDLSEIIFIEPTTEIINQAPIVFYSNSNTNSGPAFYLSNWYGPGSSNFIFTSLEDGYLTHLNASVQTLNCSLFVRANIYSVENGELKDFLGQSQSAILLNAYDSHWNPLIFNWEFENGKILLRKNQQYAVQFVIDSLPNPAGNCWAYFYGNEQQLIMEANGYKTALNNLTQKTANHNPLPEEETIFENTIVFSAQIFSYNNWPVKLEVELRSRQGSFDDQILKGDPHFFESPYLASGETAEITVGGLADGAYHWRARVIDIFGNPSNWYYYGDSQKYYRNNWESPPINIQDNSDFYVDAERTDYPENTLYYQPLAEDINDLPTFYAIWYGPDYRIFTFSPHQSGYVDSVEVAVRYGYCVFPMSAELYSLSPDQKDGLPNQFLAKSIDDIPHLISDYAQPYFESLQLDSWRFDRDVYLEAGHFYGLKIKLSDNHNWEGMANCTVRFGIRKDANNSRVYTMRSGRLYLDFDEDLRLVIYKKNMTENEKAIDSSLDSNNETEQLETYLENELLEKNEMTNSEKTADENQPLQNDNCENKAEAPLCNTSEIETNDQVENLDAELDTSIDNLQPLEEDSCFEENLLPSEEESVSLSENENILLPENIASPVETTTSTELINSSDSFPNENTPSLENFSSSDQTVEEEEILEETSTSAESASETELKAIITEEQSNLFPDDSEITPMDLSDIEEKTEKENESGMMILDPSEVEEGEKESESGDEIE